MVKSAQWAEIDEWAEEWLADDRLRRDWDGLPASARLYSSLTARASYTLPLDSATENKSWVPPIPPPNDAERG